MGLILQAAAILSVNAWGEVGHSEIAEIANEALAVLNSHAQGHARAKIKGDLVGEAYFGHREINKYPALRPLHVQPISPKWQCGVLNKLPASAAPIDTPCNNRKGNYNCILGAAYFFFDHFIHEALLKYDDDPRTRVKKIDLLDQNWPIPEHTMANKLRWLLTLVHDMHYPLAWGGQDLLYGQDIIINYSGKKYTLKKVFEEILPLQVKQKFTTKGENRYADHIAGELRVDLKLFDHDIPQWFWVWGDESGKLMCEIYGKISSMRPDPPKKGDQYDITEEIWEEWYNYVEKQMFVAGIRTAYLLENLHEHRKHIEHAKSGRGKHIPGKNWFRNLLINLAVACILIPLFVMFFRLVEGGYFDRIIGKSQREVL